MRHDIKVEGAVLKALEAKTANFIKLGEGGEWEGECLRDGTLRFGYHETPHELCLVGDWEGVSEFWRERRGNSGAGTRDMQQIRCFYEAGEDSIFITFHGGQMYWCRPCGPVMVQEDGGRVRSTSDGWSNSTIGGVPLTVERLSGHLLKVQMFRGTICKVGPFDYLLRKLNDDVLPEVAEAIKAEKQICEAILGLVRLLTWQDFELLVDLIFSASGWRRIGEVGRTQKTVDVDLILPTTGERAFVQVKSQANQASLSDYLQRFSASSHDRMFFVWHTGEINCDRATEGVTLVGPQKLAKMILDAGLSSWLREKVS